MKLSESDIELSGFTLLLISWCPAAGGPAVGPEEGSGGDQQGDRACQQDGGGLLVPHGHAQRPHRAPGSQGSCPPQLQVGPQTVHLQTIEYVTKDA